ncbi:uncharacterized protein PPP4R1L isoform X1 [Sus scrofa]|uniref:uncharacterized protein PPP4R1L isoform X1 n=1 Tax=Sus scrofa TaxID=9823 RepID=UPI000A2B721A|nr:uncharacterized protein PPP4R1L isoform X1 [Sus scrofa]XP_013840947.2 uncharacterized protein PPP4R1L isoform X1 [Sus scrofa]XP_013840948.2 uncharacterized protein PPP4R1L isoform X1 [Sus scrofa]XP_013840950.2 uncharacterized protein PPP4R1L isoform X1 [Sus scrofa]XP_013840951.2 uncharacterized protein PPP4R1L isoform X1 [Sus scrofa]XP_013840954.2 uncharacterized protein PPP4R1L isoform X1 [Sus scrofa]XP_020934056.1 uncharacterized protein PPP4R1L isoform X1 [Sus scrofa]XP_020934057.1 unc
MNAGIALTVGHVEISLPAKQDARPAQPRASGRPPALVEDRAPHPLPHHRQYDQYVSTTDPARAQTVDTDIAKHCASSLPAVALALGRPHWHSLKDTYETLASDVQRKVRRTLAFSVHEPAVILGNQLTAADRVPIFNGFLKDLDAVRTGVLRHLCAFLKVVAILQKFRSNSESALGLNFIKELTLRFGHCSKWVGRQAWAFMCQAEGTHSGMNLHEPITQLHLRAVIGPDAGLQRLFSVPQQHPIASEGLTGAPHQPSGYHGGALAAGLGPCGGCRLQCHCQTLQARGHRLVRKRSVPHVSFRKKGRRDILAFISKFFLWNVDNP